MEGGGGGKFRSTFSDSEMFTELDKFAVFFRVKSIFHKGLDSIFQLTDLEM